MVMMMLATIRNVEKKVKNPRKASDGFGRALGFVSL